MTRSPGWFAVGDDEDLLEGVGDVDLVEHVVQSDGAGGAPCSDEGAGWQVGRRCGSRVADRCGWFVRGTVRRGSWWFGFSVACQAVSGVVRPGSPWWGCSSLPWVVGLYGLPVIVSTPNAAMWATSWPT